VRTQEAAAEPQKTCVCTRHFTNIIGKNNPVNQILKKVFAKSKIYGIITVIFNCIKERKQ